MRILYPDDPLDQRQPDALFAAECKLARAAGLELSLFSFEDFERGRFVPRPAPVAGESVLYRGWMLNLEGYSRLADSIAGASARMIVSPESYRAAHHLPSWYPLVKDWTAETLIYDEQTDFTAALADVRWPGYFVKDYVKSLSTGSGSLVTSPADIGRVISSLKKYRGEVEGGVCVRRKEEYIPGSERRYFVANRKAFSMDADVPEVVAACADRISSPFFSIDVARRSDGELRLIEIGDGQVSDRKEWSPERLVEVLRRTLDRRA